MNVILLLVQLPFRVVGFALFLVALPLSMVCVTLESRCWLDIIDNSIDCTTGLWGIFVTWSEWD